MSDVRDARLFDHDPLFGHTEYFHFDPDTGGFTIETVQDVEPLLEVNKALANDAPLRWGEWTHVASLPSVIVIELTKQGIMAGPGHIADPPRFKKWLNDRNNRLFRTRHGHV